MTFRDTKSASRRQASGDERRSVNDVERQWAVRRFRSGSRVGPVFVEFKFSTEEGETGQLCLPYSELRHPKRLLDHLADYLPVFPQNIDASDASRYQFIQDLVASHDSGSIEVVPDRTGFLDKQTFVTFSEIVHANGTINDRHTFSSNSQQHHDLSGSLKGARKTVLKLACKSTYLAFAIGVTLAAPLPSYVKFFRKAECDDVEGLLSETGVFNYSGKSSSGKSSADRAAMSLVGSHHRSGTFDCSRRGLAEMASDSNDLPLVLDDTENTEDEPGVLVKTLKSIVHMVPGGRSKVISRGVDQVRFPQLRWSTFGLSSSPRPIRALAAEAHWAMTPGDQVRLFDIAVPGPESGGIFDRIPGSKVERAEKSVTLIKKLERGYQNHRGYVFRRWLRYLMRKDRSKKIFALMNEFVDRVCPIKQGWENRFAQKFGVIYAAMMLGIAANILPWSPEFAFAVARKCYRKARMAASDAEAPRPALENLKQLIDNNGVKVSVNERTPIHLPQDCAVLRYKRQGRVRYGLLDDALLGLCGSRKAKSAFTDSLAAAGVLADGHGHAGTVQERIPIARRGHVTKKPRLWVIDAKKFEKHFKRASNAAS
jgi:hypothetical protein